MLCSSGSSGRGPRKRCAPNTAILRANSELLTLSHLHIFPMKRLVSVSVSVSVSGTVSGSVSGSACVSVCAFDCFHGLRMASGEPLIIILRSHKSMFLDWPAIAAVHRAKIKASDRCPLPA